TTKARIDALPDLPTLNESGVKNFEVTAWHAIWTPKGTPEAIRSKLSASLQKALATPKLIERFAALGTVPVAPELATPAALDERFHSEVERWGKLLSAK
ncbi:MAG: tripartite tricarboxylate transporter substrate binding protein BugD, partial [Mesorhizobium sp.]